MRKAIVTGGLGFIGSHVVERLLKDKIAVTVIDNLATGRRENLGHLARHSELAIVEKDIRDGINPYFKGVDAVFHIAGLADIVPSIQKPLDYCQTNIDGTLNVLEASRHHGVRKFVYAASSSCYGIPDQYPTPETAEIRPEYPYALSKWMGEQAVLHWGKVYGMNVVSLRLFNVYGLRSRTTGAYGAVMGVFLAQKLARRPLTIVGDGTQKRDFVFVTDVAEAFYKAADKNIAQEIFNVGAGDPKPVGYLADLIGGEKEFIPKRPGEPDITFADISKIKRLLNWEPTVSLEEGVKKLLEKISDWRDAPVWTKDKIAEANKDWFAYLGKESLKQ